MIIMILTNLTAIGLLHPPKTLFVIGGVIRANQSEMSPNAYDQINKALHDVFLTTNYFITKDCFSYSKIS